MSAASTSRRRGRWRRTRSSTFRRGLGTRDISDLLVREGVIDQPYVFIGGVIALKARGDLKHGEYKFTAHASVADVVGTLIEGKVVQHAITIPEGLTSEQIVAKLQENDALTGPIKEIPHEGTLLPETYKFTRGMTREQIVQRMQSEDKKTLQDVWAHRDPDLPLKSPEQLVTLASIVEKETGKPDERSRVAAVFVNRLKRKMRLQSDPTIIYGLIGGKGSLGHPILKSEKEQPTPYNTYIIDGLPPGPIGNPGRASLEAAAQPGAHQGALFRRRRHRRPRVLGNLRAAPEERRQAPRRSSRAPPPRRRPRSIRRRRRPRRPRRPPPQAARSSCPIPTDARRSGSGLVSMGCRR